MTRISKNQILPRTPIGLKDAFVGWLERIAVCCFGGRRRNSKACTWALIWAWKDWPVDNSKEPYVPNGVQAQLDRSKTMDRILSFCNMYKEEMYVYVGFYRYKEEIFICIHNETNLPQHDHHFMRYWPSLKIPWPGPNRKPYYYIIFARKPSYMWILIGDHLRTNSRPDQYPQWTETNIYKYVLW